MDRGHKGKILLLILAMTTEMIIAHIQEMQKRLDEYSAWNYARSMVIEYLEEHGHITKPTDWAYKTIELLKELDNMKAEV